MHFQSLQFRILRYLSSYFAVLESSLSCLLASLTFFQSSHFCISIFLLEKGPNNENCDLTHYTSTSFLYRWWSRTVFVSLYFFRPHISPIFILIFSSLYTSLSFYNGTFWFFRRSYVIGCNKIRFGNSPCKWVWYKYLPKCPVLVKRLQLLHGDLSQKATLVNPYDNFT